MSSFIVFLIKEPFSFNLSLSKIPLVIFLVSSPFVIWLKRDLRLLENYNTKYHIALISSKKSNEYKLFKTLSESNFVKLSFSEMSP